MRSTWRLGVGLVAGAVTAVGIALVASLAARGLWPAYAAAAPTKGYTLVMLIMRLGVGVVATAGAAGVATAVVRDGGGAALRLGLIFLAVSLPIHLNREWADYPVWYHFLYLAYLVPIAAATGRAVSRRRARWHTGDRDG